MPLSSPELIERLSNAWIIFYYSRMSRTCSVSRSYVSASHSRSPSLTATVCLPLSTSHTRSAWIKVRAPSIVRVDKINVTTTMREIRRITKITTWVRAHARKDCGKERTENLAARNNFEFETKTSRVRVKSQQLCQSIVHSLRQICALRDHFAGLTVVASRVLIDMRSIVCTMLHREVVFPIVRDVSQREEMRGKVCKKARSLCYPWLVKKPGTISL